MSGPLVGVSHFFPFFKKRILNMLVQQKLVYHCRTVAANKQAQPERTAIHLRVRPRLIHHWQFSPSSNTKSDPLAQFRRVSISVEQVLPSNSPIHMMLMTRGNQRRAGHSIVVRWRSPESDCAFLATTPAPVSAHATRVSLLIPSTYHGSHI